MAQGKLGTAQLKLVNGYFFVHIGSSIWKFFSLSFFLNKIEIYVIKNTLDQVIMDFIS